MEYLIHYVKFGIWIFVFYVTYLSYFKQWNLNQDITFPNSFIESRFEFLSVGPRLCFQVFSNSQRHFGILKFCCSGWTSQLFSIHEKDEKLDFLNISLRYNFSQFTTELGNWDFWNPLDFIYFVRLWG